MFFSKNSNKTESGIQPFLQTFSASVASLLELADESLPLGWCDLEGSLLTLSLPFACTSLHETIEQLAVSLGTEHDVEITTVSIVTKIKSRATAIAPVTNVRNIIAVSSGKGGVGKSATAVNVAFALMQEGASVGILDADIYGPSLPTMLGTKDEHPESPDNKHMLPIMKDGVATNSIGYLVPEEDAAVWRGPMASKALMQLLNETQWPVLDYLIVDMPPGTGDVQLTMAQQVPLTGAIVVTTPQDLALADAQKGINMFEKVGIPVLGLIENMSSYACSNCGHTEFIFSQNGGTKLSERYNLPLLGSLPLSLSIREYADAGTPLLIHSPDSLLANQYREIARTMSIRLAMVATRNENKEKHIVGESIPVHQD
jgi:ATP-binding protein involved in chromosome partitioning